MNTVPAIILAGGRATRMGGGDKCLLQLGGRPLLQHVIGRLTPHCPTQALSANGDATRFAGCGLPVLVDTVADQPGPLAGILAGLDWAADRGDAAIVSVAADTPFFPRDLVARLLSAAGPEGCAIAVSRDSRGGLHEHPVFALWPVGLRDDLRAMLATGLRRVRDFATRHRAGHAVWQADGFDPFFNINTVTDLRRAEARMAAG